VINYCNRCVHYVAPRATFMDAKCALKDPNFGALCGYYDYDFQRFRPAAAPMDDQPTTAGPELRSNLWQRAAAALRNLANG
jgi:hypothetical protein